MRYVKYGEVTLAKWEIVYCNCHENRPETDEEIMKAVTTCFYDGKFIADQHVRLGSHQFENDDKLHILTETDGHQYIWQVGDPVLDMTDVVIPHAYYVRRVGELFSV